MHSLADERVVELANPNPRPNPHPNPNPNPDPNPHPNPDQVELVSTLRAHRNGLVRADLMGRLLGMWEPIPSHGTDFFLAALSALSAASKEKGIHPSPPLAGAGRPSLGPTTAKGEKGRKGGAPPEDAKERDAAYCGLEVARES